MKLFESGSAGMRTARIVFQYRRPHEKITIMSRRKYIIRICDAVEKYEYILRIQKLKVRMN